ncbi:MAG TPA: sugar phosphate isomerase/epimerase family protein [Feifaniaceae bacterium]|nr:sugar phosphate isomerase/epimerase family protein [Feifaniaceae bacterium]
MKYGCCFNMISTVSGGTGAEHLELFRRCGYDYAELPLAEIMSMSEDGVGRLLEHIRISGLPCESCNNFFPPAMRLTGPDVDVQAVCSYVDRAMETAARLGAKNIVFGSGAAKRYPEHFPKDEACSQIIRLLRYVDQSAAQYDITIAIEPLRQAECNIINTFEEGAGLARDVGGTRVKVLVDLYHLAEETEPLSHIRQYGNAFLTHIHFANPAGRVFPREGDGSGALYRAFCDAILSTGYDGRVSCEAYTSDVGRDAPETLRLLKRYFEHDERKL